jgi:hypothetical protein
MSSRTTLTLAVIGAIGWIGLVWLAIRLYATTPPTAGFDLELLLQAGRNVAAGRSPYDPALIAGTAPVAERLFYSYPPFVAQAFAAVAAVPSPVMLVVWNALALAALAFVAGRLARRLAPDLEPRTVALATVALAPLMFPLAIGMVFGNLDVFFPFLYGLLLVGVLSGATLADSIAGGVALSVAALAKLHPGSLGVWVLVRAVGAPEARRVLAAAVVVGLAILGVSLIVGGVTPWSEYAAVVRAGSGADIVDPRNGGPAAQIALLLGSGDAAAGTLARALQPVVTVLALAVSAVAAWRLRDPAESLAWAAAASLVVLPVTWFHYPSALIPFAIAFLLRARNGPAARATSVCILAAAVVAALAIGWLPLIYVAIGLVLVAGRLSRATAEDPAVVGSPVVA